MEVATLAVKYLGTALISLIVGFVICFLSALGYTTYVRFQDKKKEIEVHTDNFKLQSNTKEWGLALLYLYFIDYFLFYSNQYFL